MAELDPKTEGRIEEPVSQEAERDAADARAGDRAHAHPRAAPRQQEARVLVDRVNADTQLKAWWHVANVNAVKRLQINDHSWVHIQIVANLALKLLRQLAKNGVQPGMVRDYGMSQDDAEVVVALGAFLHCIGMAVHRERHEDWSLFLAEPKMDELLDGLYEEPDLTVIQSEVPRRSRATARTGVRSRSRPASSAWRTPWTWPRAARASPSSTAASPSTRSRRRRSRAWRSRTAKSLPS